MTRRPASVAIFRDDLLPASETFIRAQAESLTQHRAFYAGLRRLHGGLCLHRPVETLTHSTSPLDRLRRRTFLRAGRAAQFAERLRRCAPTLLHAHFAVDGALALPLARHLRLPLLVTLHGYDVTRRDDVHRASAAGRTYLRRREDLFAAAHTFICVSDFIRRSAAERGFPEDKLRVAPIGIDTDYFHPPNIALRENTVLFVGRLVEKKGCAHLIRAMAAVEAHLPGVRLVIIGDGPLRAELQSLARQHRVRATFLGNQPQLVVREWLHRCRLLSVPSVTAGDGDREGFGLVFCEAQACGVPVVSSVSGGIPEAVEHGVTGMLAPEGDHARLAEYLLSYLNHRERWWDASLSARQRVLRYFDLRRQVELLESIYEHAVHRPAVPHAF